MFNKELNLRRNQLRSTNMIRIFVLFSFLCFNSFTTYSQTLEDYAKSINSQSPSGWINGRYRLMGASYESKVFTLKTQINVSDNFNIDSLNKKPDLSKMLFSYFIASLSLSKPYRALFNTIIDNNASFEVSFSVPNSKKESRRKFTSRLLNDIISDNNLTKEELFLQGHVIATNILCPSEITESSVLEKCTMDNKKIVYHVFDKKLLIGEDLQELVEIIWKGVFWETIIEFPEAEKLVSYCLSTNTELCWLVKDKTNREFFTIVFGEKEFKQMLGIE